MLGDLSGRVDFSTTRERGRDVLLGIRPSTSSMQCLAWPFLLVLLLAPKS